MKTRLRIVASLALLFLPIVTGCGDGVERILVSGNVTHQGQPVAEGTIRFLPQKGTKAPVVSGVIKDGKYDTKATKGVQPGSYRVEIRAYNPDEPKPVGPLAPPRQQLLPPRYNSQSTLEITIEPGQKKLVKDFVLTK